MRYLICCLFCSPLIRLVIFSYAGHLTSSACSSQIDVLVRLRLDNSCLETQACDRIIDRLTYNSGTSGLISIEITRELAGVFVQHLNSIHWEKGSLSRDNP